MPFALILNDAFVGHCPLAMPSGDDRLRAWAWGVPMTLVSDARSGGPPVLDGDTWDIPPEDALEWDVSALADDSDNPYRGTRRARRRHEARRRRARRLRRVLLGLGVAALVGWLAGGASPDGDGTRSRWATAGAPPVPLAIGGPTAAPAGSPSLMASARPPVATPGASTGTTGRAGQDGRDQPSAAGAGAPLASTAPVPYVPVTYEAEAGLPTTHLFGSARVVAVAGAAGGEAVQGVGNWGGGQTGSLRFQTVSVPATGTYRVTITYVAEEVARTSTLTVSGGDMVNLTFAAGTGCCATTTVDIVLVAGTNQITLANPTGPVPLIDRLLVGTP
jgi:hypothetical protein